MNKIIGICGFIGSGKDTVADYLVTNHDYKRESFASSLKDAVAAVFSWDREMLEGKTDYARAAREKVDTWWADRLNMPDLTPRKILQLWGTEVCRNHFHTDIWVASIERKIITSNDDVVISDCRFPNEVAAIHNLGGTLIMVQRGPLPHWFEIAVRATKGNQPDIDELARLNIHQSEWGWANTTFDQVILNDGTLLDLYAKIDLLQVSHRS